MNPVVVEKQYQAFCERCRWVGDVHEFKYQAEDDGKDHDCLTATGTIVLSFDGEDEQGLWGTHRPTLQQFLLVPAEDVDS